MRTYLRAEKFIVEITDDGRGIDWPGVSRKATALGLPANNEQELRAALFHGGVSTAEQVTDISGRGIGLGAVKMATASLGGEIELETTAGHGTALRMVFPKHAMNADIGARPSVRAVAE